MFHKPCVSVLTPLYNTKPEYLRECIESVLNQTFTDFEFILLNDSPKNKELRKIAESYHDKRIRFYTNRKNIGISASRNKLLDLARGKYIAVLDHDDVCLPTRFAQQVAYMEANPDIGVLGSNIEIFPKRFITKLPSENIMIKAYLMHEPMFLHSSLMLRKRVLTENHIRYEGFYSPAEDYKLVLTLCGCTMFHHLPDVLVKYRSTSECTSQIHLHYGRDKIAMCFDYAARTYPYLCSILEQKYKEHPFRL